MGLKVMLPHSPSSSQALASVISSPKPRTRVCGFVHRSSSFFPNTQALRRSRSFEHCSVFTRGRGTVRRVCSASLEPFSDEEFAKKIEDLAIKFQLSEETSSNAIDSESVGSDEFVPPEEIFPANIERRANSVELPFSLRIIKKKLQWKEGFREAGESACCSVKKAFSSMVFIIRELHSYTLQMREILFYEDLQGILQRVQREMHASFVWLFQQVFSHTPTLMLYVMILLANFTVYSMGNNAAIAAVTPPPEVASVAESRDAVGHTHIDSSVVKTYSVSKGKNTASVGGGNGGGGKFRPVASGTDGEGRFERSERSPVLPDVGASSSSSHVCKTGETEMESEIGEEEEAKVWNAMVDEAWNLEVSFGGEGLDREDMKRFVSPVTARIESDDYAEYLRTELVYQTGLSQDPQNALLLANYAQFLYLVAHDYDRAEEYFKRAIEVEPPDAEAYNKYATFLWKVKNDLWAAEETYLEAISAEPNNSFYAANYAHFLWNTGAEDTCFPLSSPENNNNNSQEV